MTGRNVCRRHCMELVSLGEDFFIISLWRNQGSLTEREGSEAGLLNKCSCLARVFSVTKFIIVKDMILVTLCCATQVRLRCSTKPTLYN
jgi:hypothetical protein